MDNNLREFSILTSAKQAYELFKTFETRLPALRFDNETTYEI